MVLGKGDDSRDGSGVMIWRLMRGMLLHKGDDVRDDSGGCLGDGLNRQMRSQC